jgi:predicted homoserine dehydrogenase-like protein
MPWRGPTPHYNPKDVKLTSGVGEGQVISIDDIEPVSDSQAWQVREKMLEIFA